MDDGGGVNGGHAFEADGAGFVAFADYVADEYLADARAEGLLDFAEDLGVFLAGVADEDDPPS